MRKWFQFDPKFGWSELLSLVAVLLSLGAIWFASAQVNQNLPQIIVEKQVTIVPFYSDGSRADEIFAGFPLMITNRGGRDATLLKVEEAGTLPPVLRIAEDGKFTENHELDIEYALVEGAINSMNDFDKQFKSASFQPLFFPQFFNKNIDSGKSQPFVFLVHFKDRKYRSLKNTKIFFECKLSFSDGSSYRIAQAFGISDKNNK